MPDIFEESEQEKQFFANQGDAPTDGLQESEPEPQPEPEPEPEPQPEPEPEKEVEQPEGQKDPRMVPLAALHEERERRKEMAKELEQQRSKVQNLEKTWQQIQDRIAYEQQQREEEERAAREKADADSAPNFEDDPAGYLRWQQDKIADRLTQLDDWRQNQAQTEQRSNLQTQFTTQVAALEQQFRNDHPDYDHAVQYLKAHRDRELANWGLDAMARNNVINQEVMFLASNALQQGVNPAELAYNQAVNFGWQNPADVAEREAEQAKVAEEEEKAKTEAAGSAKEKMESLQRGSQASKSLSQTKGTAPENLTLESLADISDPDEFDRQWEKAFGKSKFF